MSRRTVWAVSAGVAVLLASAVAHAQCTKDVDCKGDRVCEGGKCTSPAPAAPAPSLPPEAVTLEEPAAPPPSPPAEGQPPASAAPPVGDAAAAPLDAGPHPSTTEAPAAAVKPLGADEPEVRRRNRGMMVAGIVMVSVGPLALLGALSARSSQEDCDEALESRYPDHMVPLEEARAVERCDSYTAPIYVLGIGGAVLVAAGLPMVIYGAKNVATQPAKKAKLLPWVSPTSGGLRLRLEL